MYKIYISDSVIILTGTPVPVSDRQAGEEFILAPYTGKRKALFQYIDLLEKSPHRRYLVQLFHADLGKLWLDFRSIYKEVKAAGGVVCNEAGEIAVIFRRGTWDLPKGKLDKGESFGEAALREVEEEIGLEELTLKQELGSTWHTYTEKGKRILKETKWFRMASAKGDLQAQATENIELAKWVQPKQFLEQYSPQYRSLHAFLEENFRNEKLS